MPACSASQKAGPAPGIGRKCPHSAKFLAVEDSGFTD